MQFDLNGMVELERRFGGSLTSAVVRIAKGKRLGIAVAAFSGHLTPQLTATDIEAFIRQQGELTVLRNIHDGLITPLTAGISLGPEALPERYQGLRASTGAMEKLQLAGPAGRQRQQAEYLRYAVWACLTDSHPGLSVEEVGCEITPLQYHALLYAYEEAVGKWADEEEARLDREGG